MLGACSIWAGSVFLESVGYDFDSKVRSMSEKKYQASERLYELADSLGDGNGVCNMNEAYIIMRACRKDFIMTNKDSYTLHEMEKGIGKLVTELEKR